MANLYYTEVSAIYPSFGLNYCYFLQGSHKIFISKFHNFSRFFVGFPYVFTGNFEQYYSHNILCTTLYNWYITDQ